MANGRTESLCVIQWNPSIADTIWNQPFVCYSKVSLTSGVFLVGVVLCNQAVEHNVAMFSEFPLLCAGREG